MGDQWLEELTPRLVEALGAVVLWLDLEGGLVLDVVGPVNALIGRSADELFDASISTALPQELARAIEAVAQDRRGVVKAGALRGRFLSRPGPRRGLLLFRKSDAEAELDRTNRFLDAIIENIPDMIFVKDAQTLLFERFNRAGEELLGWTRQELLGKTDHDFYPKEQADFFHEKDRETLRNKVLVDVPEEPILTKKRGLRWLHTKKVPVLDDSNEPIYLLGISEDITARKLAEERARALERELAQVAQYAPVAIISWSVEGQIVSWSPGAEKLYQLDAQAAIGQPITMLIPDSEQRAFESAQRKVRVGEVIHWDVYRSRAGFSVEVEETLFSIRDPAGEPQRLACVARDLSEVTRLRHAAELLGRPQWPGELRGEGGRSQAMADAERTADAVARDSQAIVLILGETGVGKSWLARRIHDKSPRQKGAFFEVNCASLGGELVESELFGHEQGAFTGATTQKRGLVEAADGGTLFLDEVGELPLSAQAHLLTFLDTRCFRRVGGTRTLSADARILAATNLDLQEAIKKGTFRQDLYYRLSVVPIRVPPLRERREDIPALAKAILDELISRSSERRSLTLGPRFLKALEHHHWPGNLRELRNVLERVLILRGEGEVGVELLPPELRGEGAGVNGASSLKLEDMEREHIRKVLEQMDGNRTRTAEALGVSRNTLKRKIAQYGLR